METEREDLDGRLADLAVRTGRLVHGLLWADGLPFAVEDDPAAESGIEA